MTSARSTLIGLVALVALSAGCASRSPYVHTLRDWGVEGAAVGTVGNHTVVGAAGHYRERDALVHPYYGAYGTYGVYGAYGPGFYAGPLVIVSINRNNFDMRLRIHAQGVAYQDLIVPAGGRAELPGVFPGQISITWSVRTGPDSWKNCDGGHPDGYFLPAIARGNVVCLDPPWYR